MWIVFLLCPSERKFDFNLFCLSVLVLQCSLFHPLSQSKGWQECRDCVRASDIFDRCLTTLLDSLVVTPVVFIFTFSQTLITIFSIISPSYVSDA